MTVTAISLCVVYENLSPRLAGRSQCVYISEVTPAPVRPHPRAHDQLQHDARGSPSDSLALTLPSRRYRHRAETPGTVSQNLALRPGPYVGGLHRGCPVPLWKLIARYQLGPDTLVNQRSQYLTLSPRVWPQNSEWTEDPTLALGSCEGGEGQRSACGTRNRVACLVSFQSRPCPISWKAIPS